MKIGELARRARLSTHTLRYYERIGLLPLAYRDGGGRRDYDTSILVWIAFLGRLKTTGMPIQQMLHYTHLRDQGENSGPERRALLEAHRDRVRDHIAELQACLSVLDTKIGGYADPDDRKTSHDADQTRQ